MGTVKLSVPLIETPSIIVFNIEIIIAFINQLGVFIYSRNPDTIINVTLNIANEPG